MAATLWDTIGMVVAQAMASLTTTADFVPIPHDPGGGGSPVPIPPSILLFASGLIGLAGVRRMFKK